MSSVVERKGIAKGHWNGYYTFDILMDKKTSYKLVANTQVSLKLANGFKIKSGFTK
jgi:hypothetical protein